MGKKSPRYVEIRIKGRSFSFQVLRIQYRNRKGQLAKFRKGQYLSMEVVAEREVVDKKTYKKVLRPIVVRKYSTGLKKREQQVSVETINKRIQARLYKERREITIEETLEGGAKFTYTYQKKKNKKKGLKRANTKLKKSSLSRNQTVPRNIPRAKRVSVRHRKRARKT